MDKKLYDLMNWPDIEGIVYCDLAHPKSLLGSHITKKGLLLQTFYPGAKKAEVKTKSGMVPMTMADEAGYFAALFQEKEPFAHSYVFTLEDDTVLTFPELYDTPSLMKQKELADFHNGTSVNAYHLLGAHLKKYKGKSGVLFTVWAPNALHVSVVGNFNNWDGRIHQMEKDDETGIFELFIPGITEGELYKYEVRQRGGAVVLKADPYGYASEVRPNNASVVYDLSKFTWEDNAWIASRNQDTLMDRPVSILEIHAGSFKTHPLTPGVPSTDAGESYYNYRELAPELIAYVQKQHYTHVELMPIMEYPFDGSWGYQVTGYYAPTSRYGTPDDFKYFINELHKAGIGVILDWVPAHFPKDAFGLAKFDGTCLYEHFDKRKGEHPDWGTLIYNYGRPEVKEFLISNAIFWTKEYHADGIRMDAVASMLYLDYGKRDGEWIPNIYGGNGNLEAMEFLHSLNKAFKKAAPGALLIAEESTAWPKVTGSIEDPESLGFDYKWNMGWMNDFLYFMNCDPLFRKGRYGALTFSMVYAYSEKFILTLSHDEVVHGKGSMLGKMPGATKEERAANLRAAYAFMFTHPGKKLLFMGQDFGMENEWWEARSIDWHLLEDPVHASLQKFVSDLNQLYQKEPALYDQDYDPEGFEWINNISADECIVVFVRKSLSGDQLLVVANFTPNSYTKYKVGVPQMGKYKEIFNSDSVVYGGSGHVNKRVISSKKDECDGREDSIFLNVPPMGVTILRYNKADTVKRTTKK